ncbi:DUF5343 domain-containing protein [Lysobacter sp. CFH 32150]|uniref:DUF5343 domain-containing protein n=1 Tax=Lysobacter sp. CFH 32150 TaxID=2927128 RepID=UPI001FA6C65F|nr:DUF5343 domain-containing protein [Lysobacter sp. CFH 32150]MCI4567203.1 DUF5343 domain-containing protein [Lysobacter sp. CFH 32150]
MASQPEPKLVTPPYVTYKTFINSLLKLQDRGLPARIDQSVFSGQSNSAIAALVAAYKYLGLVDENGKPSETLKKLVAAAANEADRSALMRELLESRYPFLQTPHLDLGAATTQQVESAFRDQGIKGSTITKAVSFFLSAANEAGLTVSGHVKTPTAKRSGPARSKRNGKNTAPQDNQGSMRPPQQPAKTAAELLLSKFPDFDPAWDDDIKKKWFESFSSLRGHMLGEESK